MEPANVAPLATRVESLAISALVFYWLIALPTVSVKIFRTIQPCDDDFEALEKAYMRVDYSTDCSSERYKSTEAVAWAALVMFPVGVPLVTLAVLYARKARIRSCQQGRALLNRIAALLADMHAELGRDLADHDARSRLAKQAASTLQEADAWSDRAGSAATAGGKALQKAVLAGVSLGKVKKAGRGGGARYKLRDALERQIGSLRSAHVGIRQAMSSVEVDVASPGKPD